ncbi:MAG: response regulator transcription factor [Anaerolineaceae bacterium]|nr:response regulator transcription factor [Anaerolineaceae bacterium]
MNRPVSLLIIDDNQNFLNAIAVYIEEHFTDQIRVVGLAQTSLDGIELGRRLHPQVVLLDLKMPDVHGFMVIPALRQVLPEVKIITTSLLSAELFNQSGDIYETESQKAGADTFIPKLNLETDLIRAVQTMLEAAPWQ